MIVVLVPTVGRADRLARVAANVHEATSLEHLVVFVVEEHDEASLKAACELDEAVVINRRKANWAGALNTAVESLGPVALTWWYMAAADDLRFEPGWDVAATMAAKDGALVVGTNDLHNRDVLAGTHATHLLVSARLVWEVGAVFGDPLGTLAHEGYDGQYVDTDLVGYARHRGWFTPCLESHVEHVHPAFGLAERDATYERSWATTGADAALFEARRQAWLAT